MTSPLLIVTSGQWWIFKIGGLRQNCNKGLRKINVAIKNGSQTTPPSTTLQGRFIDCCKKIDADTLGYIHNLNHTLETFKRSFAVTSYTFHH